MQINLVETIKYSLRERESEYKEMRRKKSMHRIHEQANFEKKSYKNKQVNISIYSTAISFL